MTPRDTCFYASDTELYARYSLPLMNGNIPAAQSALNSNGTEDSLSRRSNLLLFGLGVLLFVAVRLRGLTASCLWFDEIFSVHAARHNWSELLSFVAADLIHPPLFYALLKVWIAAGGESLTWLRLFPALTSIATIVPFLLLCRELKLTAGERNLALLLMAVSGFLIKYAQEVRMYTLLLFFSLCSLWLLLKLIKNDSRAKQVLIALTLSNVLLVYTHYSGWVLVAVQCVAVFLWQRRGLLPFMASTALLVVTYLPWLFALKTSAEPGKGLAQNIGWVGRPGLKDIAQSITVLNKPFSFSQSSTDSLYDPFNTTLAVLLWIVPLAIFGWRLIKGRQTHDRDESQPLRLLFLFAFAPALLIFLLSWILPHSIWGTRHLIIGAGPYSILAALSLKRLRPYWARVTVFLLLTCWCVIAGMFLLMKPSPQFIWCAWEPMAHEVARVEPDSAQPIQIYALEDLVAYHLWYGLDPARNPKFKVGVIKGVPDVDEDTAYFLPRRFAEISVHDQSALPGNDFWIAIRARQGEQTPAPLSFFIRQGYSAGPPIKRTAQGQDAILIRLHRK